MDLVPDHGFDDNLFPFDPDWAYHICGNTTASMSCPIETGQIPDANQLCGEFKGGTSDLGSPSCSSQPVTQDRPGLFSLARQLCPLGRHPYYSSFHGHINWEPATYEGILTWDKKSKTEADDDYSLNLRTFGGAGATLANPAGVHIEFDSDETIDHFDGNSWWKQFHNAVDMHGAQAGDMIDGDRAVVTGLVGLDTAHDPALESHPVYSIAIQTDRKSALSGGADRWAIFARSWGNEGYCSSNNHTLPPGPLTVRIPWQDGATGVLAGVEADPARQVQITRYDLSSNISPHGTVAASVLQGEGVLLTFDLSAPASREPRYWGTVDLKWTFGPPSALAPPDPSGPLRKGLAAVAPTSVPPSQDGEASDVEAIAERLWSRLPRATRLRTLAHIHIPTPFIPSATRPVATTMEPPPISSLRHFDAFVSPLPDPAFLTQGKAELRAMCAAYRNRVPGFPTMCRSRRRK